MRYSVHFNKTRERWYIWDSKLGTEAIWLEKTDKEKAIALAIRMNKEDE